MSQSTGFRPLGWTPPLGMAYEVVELVDLVDLDIPSVPGPSFSPLATLSSPSVVDPLFSQHVHLVPRPRPPQGTPMVPRPRNSFIIFRCSWIKTYLSQQESRMRTTTISGRPREPSLSMRAALAWHQLSPMEKQPWEMLALQEREEHAIRYPFYHFYPSPRHPSGKKKGSTSRRCSKARAESDTRSAPAPAPAPEPEAAPDFELGPASAPVPEPAPASESASFPPTSDEWSPNFDLPHYAPGVEWGNYSQESYIPSTSSNAGTNGPGIFFGGYDLPAPMPIAQNVEPVYHYIQPITDPNYNFITGQNQYYSVSDMVEPWNIPMEPSEDFIDQNCYPYYEATDCELDPNFEYTTLAGMPPSF